MGLFKWLFSTPDCPYWPSCTCNPNALYGRGMITVHGTPPLRVFSEEEIRKQWEEYD